MNFDNTTHRHAWAALDALRLQNPNIEAVGRPHRGLEECLTAQGIDRSKDYLIMEIGSELGGSTRFFMEFFPAASIVCVDPWPAGYKLPKELTKSEPDLLRPEASLYDVFLHFCRQYKDRILPIRDYSSQGIVKAHGLGLCPDIVYIDGDHRYLGVLNDLILVHNLFPGALIVGDDWNFSSKYPVYKGIQKSVQKAARDFSEHFALPLTHQGNTYVVRPSPHEERMALNYTVSKKK